MVPPQENGHMENASAHKILLACEQRTVDAQGQVTLNFIIQERHDILDR